MYKILAEKFSSNQTTRKESKVVLEWFETAEGKQFFEERIEKDWDLMDRKDLRSAVSDLDSEKLFSSIKEEIINKRKKFFLRRTNWLGFVVNAAATVMIIFPATCFSLTSEICF